MTKEQLAEMTQKHAFLFFRIAMGAIFVYAGISKIMDPVIFAGHVASYKILPYFGNNLVAATLPWIEVFSGIMLIMGLRTRAASGLVILMNLVFIMALISVIVRGLDIDCGCFQQGGAKTSPWTALFRDIGLLVWASFIFQRTRSSALSEKENNGFPNT